MILAKPGEGRQVIQRKIVPEVQFHIFHEVTNVFRATGIPILLFHSFCYKNQKPYFSWIIESEQKNVMQTVYQLVITNEKGTVVWDTGIRESSTSAFVPYEGAQLESCTRYQVKLKVWDNYEEQAEAEGTFETAFLKESDWKAKWAESPIKRKKGKKGFGKQYPATMFRKEFYLSGKVKKARAYVTSHGIYRLSMNGERIGANVIGMYVGEGWYMSPYTLTSPGGIRSLRIHGEM